MVEGAKIVRRELGYGV